MEIEKTYTSDGSFETIKDKDGYVRKEYYPNGLLHSEVFRNYENRIHGLERGWHSNGQLYIEGWWIDGLEHGPDFFWHEDGSRDKARVFKNGDIHGVGIRFEY